MKSRKVVTGIIIICICCFAIIFLCLGPFVYFMIFPATEETSKQAMQLPKGLVVEYCFNFATFELDGMRKFFMDIRWAAPGSFAVSMRSPYFTRCGYLPWLPFVKYPKTLDLLYVNDSKIKLNENCIGDCP